MPQEQVLELQELEQPELRELEQPELQEQVLELQEQVLEQDQQLVLVLLLVLVQVLLLVDRSFVVRPRNPPNVCYILTIPYLKVVVELIKISPGPTCKFALLFNF